MKNLLGVMQGRLSPPRNGRIQSFPIQTWREEFPKAQRCGLEIIEWIFEAEQWDQNPLMSAEGIQSINTLSQTTGVRVISVCADYFMDLPLLRVTQVQHDERLEMLKRLMVQCSRAGIQYIEIPFVDASAIHSPVEMEEVTQCIRTCAPLAEQLGLQICLETSLAPNPFAELLRRIDHPAVKVNYDIGNSASLGYNTRDELNTYGPWIATVHIKDRVKGGITVPLGTGNADFKATFERLSALRYQGPFIFQSARQGDEEQTLRSYMNFVKPFLNPLEVSLN